MGRYDNRFSPGARCMLIECTILFVYNRIEAFTVMLFNALLSVSMNIMKVFTTLFCHKAPYTSVDEKYFVILTFFTLKDS